MGTANLQLGKHSGLVYTSLFGTSPEQLAWTCVGEPIIISTARFAQLFNESGRLEIMLQNNRLGNMTCCFHRAVSTP